VAKSRFGLRSALHVVSRIVHARATRSEVPDLAFGWRDGRPAAAERLLSTAGGAGRTGLFFDIPGYSRSIAEFDRVDIDRYSKRRNSAEITEIHGSEEGRFDDNA